MAKTVDAVPAPNAGRQVDQTDQVDRTLFANLVAKHLRSPLVAAGLPFDRNLFELGLDSLGAARLLLEIEKTFGIIFPEGCINVELFASAATLERTVTQLIAGEC